MDASEGVQVLDPNSDECAPAVVGQRCYRAHHVINLNPVVASLTPPARAQQGEARHAGPFTGLAGMIRDDRGEGMGGVDDHGNGLGAEIVGEAGHAAETADPDAAGKRRRIAGAPGQGGDDLKPLAKTGNRRTGQAARLGGAAENEQLTVRHGR